MGKEIEVKFLNIDKNFIIKKMSSIGAEKIHDEILMRRSAYNLPIRKANAWARVRDEGEKVTMSYKCVNSKTVDGVDEVELVINDFDSGCEFLRSLGLSQKAYQETKRISYRIKSDNVYFNIDTWPALEPWLEIEAGTEKMLKKYAKKLGFVWDEGVFGSADYVYAQVYKIKKDWINNKCPKLQFSKLPPELKPSNYR